MNAAEFYKNSATSFIMVDPEMQAVIFDFAEAYAASETVVKEAAEQRADLALKDLAKVQNYGLGCESDYTKLKEEFVAAEEQVKELRLSRDGISRALSNRNEYIIGLHKQLAAAEAEGGRAVRALQEILADQSIDWIMGGRLRAIAERGVSPVPVPAPQKCPTCGYEVRCIHGIDFRDKCETCEAIESYYEAGPAPTKEK